MAKASLVPPSDVQAEQAILGAVMIDPKAWFRVWNIITEPEMFYSLKHQHVFNAFITLQSLGQPMDIVAVSAQLRAMKFSGKEAPDDYYLTELVSSVPFPRNVDYYCKIVREKWLLRGLIEVGERVASRAFEFDAEPGEIEEMLMNKLLSVKNEIDLGYQSSYELSDHIEDHVAQVQQNVKKIVGIDTGYMILNGLTMGFQKGDLIIVAARPSMGKTALALNLMLNAARLGTRCGFVSIEMTPRELMLRLATNISGIDYYKIRACHKDVPYKAIFDKIRKLPIWIDNAQDQSVFSIRSKAKLLALKGIDILFIDYLQLITQPENNRTENHNIGLITKGLKGLARELNIPIVLLSQLSRKCEDRTPPRPRLADLRDSGNIEQDADMVIFIYRQEYYDKQANKAVDPEIENLAEIIVAKNRNGLTGNLKLGFWGEYQRFAPLANVAQDPGVDQRVLNGNMPEANTEDVPF